MKRSMRLILCGVTLALAATAAHAAHTIAPEQIDDQKIYYGNAKSFEKPAAVDYTAVVKATPEYSEIKKKKIDSTSARYWILMSSASDHAVKLISQVGEETEHDLIVSIGYLGSLNLPVEAVDVTPQVLSKLGQKGGAPEKAESDKSGTQKAPEAEVADQKPSRAEKAAESKRGDAKPERKRRAGVER